MNKKELPNKIAFLGDYLPRKCGIASFNSDLYTIISSQYPKSDCFVVSVNDIKEGYNYPEEVRIEIEEQELISYQRAADYLNINNTEVVSLQHEFGIYGGQSGSHILALLRYLHLPVVITLHTILEKPNLEQLLVMQELIKHSARLISMIENKKAFDIGLKSLRWLLKTQTSDSGNFKPIGSGGFYYEDGNGAKFDLHPIEAYSMLFACLEASRATDDKCWLGSARMIFEWFLGRIDLGIPVYSTQTGGCHDARHVDRINQNQGGESTIAFLLSMVEMHIMENSFRSFERLKGIEHHENIIEKQNLEKHEGN